MIISIVTPSLNGIQYLRHCIRSAKRQESERVQVEHILVDGGSTDGTPEYAAAQGCTVMHRDGGIYEALNIGFRSARGTLFGTLGCDDFLMPGALDVVAATYERYRPRWIVGGSRWLDAEGRNIGSLRAAPRWLTAPMLASLGWCCIPSVSTFIDRQFLTRLCAFDTTFEYIGDYDLFVRALEVVPFARIPQVLACSYHHGGNISMRLDDTYNEETRRILERYAPTSKLDRSVQRLLLKAWLNATNPWWFTMKMAHKIRPPLNADAVQSL